MEVVVPGKRRERLEVLLGHVQRAQYREFESREQPAYAAYGPRSVIRSVVGHIERVGDTLEAVGHVLALALERLGQDETDCEPMRDLEQAADCLAQRVLSRTVRDVH